MLGILKLKNHMNKIRMVLKLKQHTNKIEMATNGYNTNTIHKYMYDMCTM